ncbi:uncharacterized protein LOC128203241 [Mya arenaria]|uniref:uncharacterized protein LOC128203241 n=1 Tax=Mya arenaria TaxID=6604 RepID=UPI0022E4B555|nr:uncharacterized protein LOC128203241 [Mya arenaria]
MHRIIKILITIAFNIGSVNNQRAASDCTFDICVMSPCLNDGTCYLDDACNFRCACPHGYKGERCETVSMVTELGEDENRNLPKSAIRVPVSLETHLENLEDTFQNRTCEVNDNTITCSHGVCTPNAIGSLCSCDTGWTGSLCDSAIPENKVAGEPVPNSGIVGPRNRDDKTGVSSLSDSVLAQVAELKAKIDKSGNNQNKDLYAKTKPNENNLFSIMFDKTLAPTTKSHSISSKFSKQSAQQKPFGLPKLTDTTLLYPRYNACQEGSPRRPMSERKCPSQPLTHACVYGKCIEEVGDHGGWSGAIFTCECDVGARKTRCDELCCLDCGENGRCNLHGDQGERKPVCDCMPRYIGERCETFVPHPVSIVEREATWYLWVVGSCVGAFLVLLVTSIAAPYYMWKNRVILIMKIVYYFQGFEDDDEKQFDAFVSYKSHPRDEGFVVRTLYQKLEKELGFRLCLHYRDFVPGETISNNIINAVDASRRTILILTPRYVESEFTRFEYQKAQQEMLKRKHKIIPILLDDISDLQSTMDKNLKGIINSVTYLEWPEGESDDSKKIEKFWKRLLLSMPKKKVSDTESSSTSSSNGSNVTSSTQLSQTVSLDMSTGRTSSSSSMSKNISFTSSTERISALAGEKTFSPFEDDSSVYDEIGKVERDYIKPLSEKEELELEYRSNDDYNTINDDKDSYIDMEDDRYIEFRPEDQDDFTESLINAFNEGVEKTNSEIENSILNNETLDDNKHTSVIMKPGVDDTRQPNAVLQLTNPDCDLGNTEQYDFSSVSIDSNGYLEFQV